MIKGWVHTTLLDYPGEIASLVFTGGCNFRCPMCHNGDLVCNPAAFATISPETIFEFLEKRQGKITGVVISGGEPCLSAELTPFLIQLRQRGLHIKLDSNGYRPDVLEDLLNQHLVDFIAMDIKAPPEKYALLSRVPSLAIDKIQTSINLIRTSGLAYEFRTTVVPDWLTLNDIQSIGEWLHGAQRYALQQFRPMNCLDPHLNEKSPYPVKFLEEMKTTVELHFDEVWLRGVRFKNTLQPSNYIIKFLLVFPFRQYSIFSSP